MDIGSSSQPPVTNVAPTVLIECPNCHAKNTVLNSFIERPVSLEVGLVEGMVICPDCGHEKRSYWMSKGLKTKRAEIFGKISVLAQRRTPLNFKRVKELKEEYKILFDAEQEKYQAILGVVETLEKEDVGPT